MYARVCVLTNSLSFLFRYPDSLSSFVCSNKSKIAQTECKCESLLSDFAEVKPIFKAKPQRALVLLFDDAKLRTKKIICPLYTPYYTPYIGGNNIDYQ